MEYIYKYKDKTYNFFSEVEALLPNIGFPSEPTNEQLKEFGIERLERAKPLEEIKAEKLNSVYFEYLKDRDKPTEFEIDGVVYLFDRHAPDIVKFHSAHEVSKLQGNSGYGIKNKNTGESVFLELTKENFDKVLIKSADEQKACYAKFYAARNTINGYSTKEEVEAFDWKIFLQNKGE